MGEREFDAWYSGLYGGRWPALRAALREAPRSVAFDTGLRAAYHLDYASVLAAQSLRLPEDGSVPEGGTVSQRGTVLDACAAPGGKSLVLASRLGAGETTLLANELSSERRRRLVTVLDGHLDAGLRRRVTVSGFDAAALAGKKSEHGRFAAILLDAPCSSERHVLNSPKHLALWTPARPRELPRRQWALLSAAFLLLRPAASLVYATCSLSGAENDAVAARLLAKYGGRVTLDRPDFAEGEETACGRIILPDRCGMGPLYVARFWKAE